MVHRSLRAVAMGICALLLWSGCATTSEFEALQTRVSSLERDRRALAASMHQDMERLERLHTQLTEAEQTLRKSGANLGLRVERLEAGVPGLRGDLEQALHTIANAATDIQRLKEVARDRLGATSVFLPHSMPDDADGLWALAEKTGAQEGHHGEAQALYDYFDARFGDDPRADDALRAIGRLQEADGDIEGAIETYKRTADRYPEGDQAPLVTLRIGELSEATGACGQAEAVYKYVQRLYKDAPAGDAATDKLKGFRKRCKDE